MIVTIKSITNSTVVFKNGLCVRGNSNNIEMFPNSILRNIEINDDFERELKSFINSGHITVIQHDSVTPVQSPEVIVEDIESTIVAESVEEVQATPEPVTEPVIAPVTVPVTVPLTEQPTKQIKPAVNNKKPSKIKSIKKISKTDKPTVFNANPSEGSVVYDVEQNKTLINDSLIAGEEFDKNEKKIDMIEDDSLLPVQDKRGNDVVIATGNNKVKVTKMSSSVADSAHGIVKENISFVEEDDHVNEPDFIDTDHKSDPTSDAFIEI